MSLAVIWVKDERGQLKIISRLKDAPSPNTLDRN